ncbi:MAG: hypothetical protein ACRDL5_15575, partial [Solirubrobacteraceae bacterium]
MLVVVTLAAAAYAAVLPGNGSSARAALALCTSGAQTFTATGETCYQVGAGVDYLLITAVGAPGGSIQDDSGSPPGSLGTQATAVVPVSAGQILYADVGGPGGNGV